jgi:hypothetical protein
MIRRYNYVKGIWFVCWDIFVPTLYGLDCLHDVHLNIIKMYIVRVWHDNFSVL